MPYMLAERGGNAANGVEQKGEFGRRHEVSIQTINLSFKKNWAKRDQPRGAGSNEAQKRSCFFPIKREKERCR